MHYNLNIAVVIPWSINNDSRAQRSIHEMSKNCLIDVFFIPKNENDIILNGSFNKNVRFHSIKSPKENIFYKIIQNSFFYYRYAYFKHEILNKNIEYDIVYIHDLISGHIGNYIKKKLKCKLIYDVHDLYIETLNQEFPLNKNGKMNFKHKIMFELMKRIGTSYEKKIIKNSDLIFTVNESCANYLKEKYNRKDINYFRNFPVLKQKPLCKNLLSKNFSLSKDCNIIIYIGSIAKGRQLRNIVKCGKYLEKKNKIIIIGNGVFKNELVHLSKNEETYNKNVYFMNSINYNQLFETISEAKIGLMLLNPINKSKEFALANKITEYMLCGIVPVLSDHIEHKKLDPKNTFSIITNNYTPKGIACVINKVLKKTDYINHKSLIARREFENTYNWENEKEKFLKPFNLLIDDCNY